MFIFASPSHDSLNGLPESETFRRAFSVPVGPCQSFLLSARCFSRRRAATWNPERGGKLLASAKTISAQ